ncbi:hypothetical protein, partial [Paenibacillus sp. HGH0039]|uniref:hypothetical protein n=1 Tax=Paenibacillus sp. HGH0039 TaxID=1078505 RepID=UPI0018CBEA1A
RLPAPFGRDPEASSPEELKKPPRGLLWRVGDGARVDLPRCTLAGSRRPATNSSGSSAACSSGGVLAVVLASIGSAFPRSWRPPTPFGQIRKTASGKS